MYTYPAFPPPKQNHIRDTTGQSRAFCFRVGEYHMAQPLPNNLDRRLDSWKEIATFFDRDERTVRRWEKENDLPIHRVPGGTKGRVFAYESELRRWLAKPQPEPRVMPSPPLQIIPAPPAHRDFRHRIKLAFTLALAVALVAAVVFYRIRHHSVVSAATREGQPHLREAEDFYLQGRYFWNKRTPEDLNKAVDLFTQAIVRDPAYAKAYVGLADSYNLLREYSAMPPDVAYPRALAAAKKAVELDDTSAEAHNSLAFVTFYWSWDAETAEREFRRAIELNPGYSTAHHWYATFLLVKQRFPEALQQIDLARKLDPSCSAIMADQAFILYHSGNPEGISRLKAMETSDPAFLSPHVYLAEIYAFEGDYPDFLKESRHVAELRRDLQAMAIVSAAEHGYAAGGVSALWNATLAVQLKFHANGTLPSFALAQTYARLGRSQQALQYLHDAYNQHDAQFLFVGCDPALASLHGDPSFGNLLALSRQPRLD